jgi:hypothetical protein
MKAVFVTAGRCKVQQRLAKCANSQLCKQPTFRLFQPTALTQLCKQPTFRLFQPTALTQLCKQPTFRCSNRLANQPRHTPVRHQHSTAPTPVHPTEVKRRSRRRKTLFIVQRLFNKLKITQRRRQSEGCNGLARCGLM